MILDTCSGATVVVATGCLTVGVVLSADVVRKSLGILRSVWRQAIRTNAAIRQGGRVTGVRVGRCRIAFPLQADQRALGNLRVAPDLWPHLLAFCIDLIADELLTPGRQGH